MKKQRVETYDAGYSRDDLLKKCAAAASAALLCGGLTACGNDVMGDLIYQPSEIDGNMVVQNVSESDITDTDEPFTLDGDVVYTPESHEAP